MPPRKRATRSTAASSGGRQAPLSFGTSKITKPGALHSGKELGKSAQAAKAVDSAADISQLSSGRTTPLRDEVREEVEEQVQQPQAVPAESQTLALRPDTKEAPAAAPTRLTDTKPNADEQAAAAIKETQIKKYWKAKEDSRIFPRVHQTGLSLHEKVLREFDLSSQYGPCIGILRTKRWHRARKLGLEPPIEVLAVLLREMDDAAANAKGKRTSGASDDGRATNVQVAYVDELMGAKGLVDEVR